MQVPLTPVADQLADYEFRLIKTRFDSTHRHFVLRLFAEELNLQVDGEASGVGLKTITRGSVGEEIQSAFVCSRPVRLAGGKFSFRLKHDRIAAVQAGDIAIRLSLEFGEFIGVA